MTEVEMLKKLTGESDEELLSLLLQVSEEKILSKTRRSVMITPLKPYVREWAIIAYNRLGMQGETSRSEAGISSAFAEIPKEITEGISEWRIARVGGHAHEKINDETVQPQTETQTG